MISSIYAAVLNLSLSVFKFLSVSNTVREVSHIAHVSEFSKKHNKTSKNTVSKKPWFQHCEVSVGFYEGKEVNSRA